MVRSRFTVYYLAGSPLEARKNSDYTYAITRAQGEVLAHAFRMPGRRSWFFVETTEHMLGVPTTGTMHGPHPRLSDVGKHVWNLYAKRKNEEKR